MTALRVRKSANRGIEVLKSKTFAVNPAVSTARSFVRSVLGHKGNVLVFMVVDSAKVVPRVRRGRHGNDVLGTETRLFTARTPSRLHNNNVAFNDTII